jgi:hypothetical protein
MNPIINLEFIPPNVPDYEGVLKVTVSSEAEKFLDSSSWPISFRIYSNSNKVVWETELSPGTWSAYAYVTYTHAEVVSNTGVKFAEWKWDTFQHGDFCHQAFYSWCLKNKGAKGIAIGTHDGTSGEWVGPVTDSLVKAVLIEPSTKQFQELSHLYSKRSNVTLLKTLITPEGGKVEFFEAGAGHTNSVNPDHIKKYLPGMEISSQEINSLTMRQLTDCFGLGNGDPWWLHMDVEDLDDKLLMSFDHSGIKLPDCLIFEHENLTTEREEALLEWCRSKRYDFYKSGRNTICFAKKEFFQ